MSDGCPLVCICIPTYNAEETIRETLASVVNQHYSNLIILVVDNASTDGTLAVVDSFSDPRISIYRNEINVGGEGNFNRCIRLAKGKYAAIYHADDVYEPSMVAKQVAFLEANTEAGAVFTEASLIDEAGNRIGEIRLPKGISSQGGLYDFAAMFKAVMRHSNFFICPSFMVRTQVYQQDIKVWRGEQFGSGADLDVWFRILQNHPIGHLPERLIRYRISNNQFSARVRWETEPGVIFKIVDHYLGQGRVKAMLNTNDHLNYKWLERRDRVGRALNLFLTNRPQEAGRLLSDIYSRDALRAAFRSKRGLLTLVVGVYVKLLITMGLNKIGKISLTYIKQVTHR